MLIEGFYYLTIKRNELSSHKETCMLLSERSQSEKATSISRQKERKKPIGSRNRSPEDSWFQVCMLPKPRGAISLLGEDAADPDIQTTRVRTPAKGHHFLMSLAGESQRSL